jgi:decaprenylphospho-beta-D-ribofuranose 2-oxidase
MKCSAWGMYPQVECEQLRGEDEEAMRNILAAHRGVIAYGNGRSYGDSALSQKVLMMRPWDHFLGFDAQSGLLHVQAGVLLSEILEHFVPRGWFLRVTPGTKLITVGGAIASDVHGKNHHVEGCFSQCVASFRMMNAEGEVLTCTPEETPELFHATCGGMGLTGVILDAQIYLKRIQSTKIEQQTIKTRNLKETFEAFEAHSDKPYSVAWIDCLAKGESRGKSLLMVGDFAEDGDLSYRPKSPKSIPFNFPTFALNTWSVRAFNWLYYAKAKSGTSHQKVDIDTFFYPLDAIGHWNRIYGKRGFTQYQFILPKEHSYEGLEEVLSAIADSGKGSFLAVLKLYGPANENWLSFPIEGYSLALDFKIEEGLFGLLDQLDEIVLRYGGRLYLTKDVRVSRETFEQGYPQIERFREFRRIHGMDTAFCSLQSQRVGI